jgi:uncharacterized protein YdhG (YjbR/CyaY superfamily)
MQSKAPTVEAYINELPEERKEPMERIRKVILKNIPEGFKEEMSYGMIGYVIPHSLYPKGYHCDPALPLPLINLGSQKNFIALHHMGIYSSKELLDWFIAAYPNHCKTKLDMGKGCIRFKKMEDIPYDLIGALVAKMTAKEWIHIYENNLLNRGKAAE